MKTGFPKAYTVVGNVKKQGNRNSSLSLLVLNRGGRLFHTEYLKNLECQDFRDILWIEDPPPPRDIENLALQFPQVRFLLLPEPASPGEKINLAIRETQAPWLLVLWNDIPPPRSTSLFRERWTDPPPRKGSPGKEGCLCLTPGLIGGGGETLPVIRVPVYHKKRLKVLCLPPDQPEKPTLYPFDYAGIYNREKFQSTGGFDGDMKNPYWQKMDFGFRAFMWGEKILCDPAFRLHYTGETPQEETTPDEDYLRFSLKNLQVRVEGKEGFLPPLCFWLYLFRSGAGFASCRRQFKEIAGQVRLWRDRYRYDASGVTDLWEEDY
ncbi:MAG: hypothetical protein LBQ61_09580 [Spirochaetales bacterium]|nr:hypothetical protein [Spirochaetales bacterium]